MVHEIKQKRQRLTLFISQVSVETLAQYSFGFKAPTDVMAARTCLVIFFKVCLA